MQITLVIAKGTININICNIYNLYDQQNLMLMRLIYNFACMKNGRFCICVTVENANVHCTHVRYMQFLYPVAY